MSDEPKTTQPASDTEDNTEDDTEGHMHTFSNPEQVLQDKSSRPPSPDGDDDDDVEGHIMRE